MTNNVILPLDFDLNGEPLPENHEPRLSDYEELRITDSTVIPAPIPVIKIAGEIISTPAAITFISGLPKSGKSAFCSILIAGAITTGEIDGLDQVEVLANDEKKAVIHFDTEQAPWKHQANQSTILKRANMNGCPDYYLSYNFRCLEIDEMILTVRGICNLAAQQFGGIHSIFVDGIADFIRDPNDAGASFDIIKYFDGIAQKFFCPVITVLHTNPGSDKERGHLGSQAQRKGEGIISVKKEGNISYLDPKFLRHAGDNIPKIQFRYDYQKGYHIQCVVDTPQNQKVAEKLSKLKHVSERVFSGQRAYKWGEAIEAVMKETALGKSTAINIFKEMKVHDLVRQGDDKNWRGLEV